MLQLRQVPRQQVGHFLSRGEAVSRSLGMQSRQQIAQPRRQLWVDLPNGSRHLLADPPEHGHGIGRAEGGPPGTHHVQHAAQAEQVGTIVHRLPLGLFRRHVHRRARHHPGLGQAGVIAGPRQAKVGDLDALDPVLQKDIGWLDVAVDQPLPVRRRQPLRDLHTDAQDLLQRQLPGAVELLLQRGAVDELHDQVGHRAGILDSVDVDDVVLGDGGGGPRLAREALPRHAARRQLGSQRLDGNDPVQLGVERPEHHPHGASSDDFQGLVTGQAAEGARLLGRGQEVQPAAVARKLLHDRHLHEVGGLLVGAEQGLDPLA